MSYVVFVDENGAPVTVSAANPLPTTGAAGGGGLQASDITATAPVTWNSTTTTIAVTTGTAANTLCTGNDTRLTNARTPTAHAASHKATGTDSLAAAHVANADPTSLATLAASVDALRTALVTAGLMAAS